MDPLMSSTLFEPIALRGLTLKNRIAVSPMCQYISDNGNANDWHLMHYGSMSCVFIAPSTTDISRIGQPQPLP